MKTLSCIYCKGDLKDNARFCRHCSHFQTKWKNWVPHIGGAIALLIFVSSIVSLIIKPARDYYKKITWKDEIEVVYFSSNASVVVGNFGDGDVFLESITYKSFDEYGKGFSMTNVMNMTAEKLKFATYKIVKDIEPRGVVTRTQKFTDNGDKRVLCKIDDPALRRFQDFKIPVLIFPCEAELTYYSLNSKNKRSVDIPCVAYLTEKLVNRANSADAKNRAAD